MEQVILIVCMAGAVASAGYWLASFVLDDEEQKLRERLAGDRQEALAAEEESGAMPLISRIGQAAAEPFMPTNHEKVSRLRRSLAMAGIYAPGAFRLVIGAKVICLGVGVLGGYLAGSVVGQWPLGVSLGGMVGYLLPQMWLKMRIKAHQTALNHGLPDALDLMVVCMEAGLTVDAAMQRVGQELALAHPGLSRELEIAHMETRMGLSRSESLKNMGRRTQNLAVQTLVAMLVQAERFGTSIAQSLRVHADSLRVARQQAAEELAGRASVKLSFPLVLFIFPATFIVLGGPTVLSLMKSSL